MIELWQAINSYFLTGVKSQTFRSLLTGGLWNIEAKQGTPFPYGTFELITDTPSNFASGKNFIENCLIQFNLFSNKKSAEDVLRLFDALVACFDFENIVVNNYVVRSCVRETMTKLKVDNVWQINVRYRILLEPGES